MSFLRLRFSLSWDFFVLLVEDQHSIYKAKLSSHRIQQNAQQSANVHISVIFWVL